VSTLSGSFDNKVSLSGNLTNLLRLARNECQGVMSFLATGSADALETMTFPRAADQETLNDESIVDLVLQTSADPEFGHGGAFVRRIVLEGHGEPLTVTVVPIEEAQGLGVLGVIGNEASVFEQDQLQCLERIARRLSRHLQARRRVGEDRTIADGDPHPTASTSEQKSRRPDRPDRPDRTDRPDRPDAFSWRGTGSSQHLDPFRSHLTPPITGTRSPSTGLPELLEHTFAGSRARSGFGSSLGSSLGSEEELVESSRIDKHVTEALRAHDEVTGLGGLGAFFSRVGRLLQAGVTSTGTLAIVIVEVEGSRRSDDFVAQLLASTLRAQLRVDDPLVRIGQTAFAAVVALTPGSAPVDAVEARLARAIRTALGREALHLTIRSAHLVSQPGERREADELLRQAVGALPIG